MALGTGTKVIGGKTVNIGTAASAPVLGTGGLVMQGLTVKLTTRGSGYNYKGVALRKPGTGGLKRGTIQRRPTLKNTAPKASKIQRGPGPHVATDPLFMKARTIT